MRDLAGHTCLSCLALLLFVADVVAQDSFWWTQVFHDEGLIVGADCADARHCMIVTREGIGMGNHVSKSTDGGFTWTRVLVDSGQTVPFKWPLQFGIVSYPDSMHAIVTADSGYIFRTADGGQTWERQRLDTITKLVHTVSMFDSKRAVVTLDYPRRMQITDDGGLTWREIPDSLYRPSPAWRPAPLVDVLYIGPSTIVGVLRDTLAQLFIRSDDGGDTWSNAVLPVTTDANVTSAALTFIDTTKGWASCFKSSPPKRTYVVRTVDGGKTWTKIVDSAMGRRGAGWDRLSFANALSGLAPSSGEIFRTTDGGLTWSQDSMNTTKPINRVIYHRGHPGLAVAWLDHVYRYLPKVSSIEVESPISSPSFFLPYPNPVHTSMLRIASRNGASPTRIYVASTTGAVIRTQEVHMGGGAIGLDISDVADGVYVVRIIADGQVESHLVSVAR